MRTLPLFLTVLFFVMAVSAVGAEEPETERFFRLEVDTPPVVLNDAREGGFAVVTLDGFETRERKIGYPDIPRRTVLVAIPPGAEPRLEVRTPGTVYTRSVLPRPVGREVAELADPATGNSPNRDFTTRRRSVYRADPTVYEADRVYPTQLAWLGQVGVLRGQRYVELHIAPVRYTGSSRELLIEPELELTVHFDGWDGERHASAPEERFESIYRSAFVNYGQGREFRLIPSEPGSVVLGRATAAGAGAPRRRIVVREEGVVRLDYALFAAEAPEFLAHDPGTWRLTSRGQQVPLRIRQGVGNPNAFEFGEWVQFWGQGLDDEPIQVLNTDNGGVEDLYEVRDYSDDNIYFLTVEASSQPAMAEREAAPMGGTFATTFVETARLEIDDTFLPLPNDHVWYWSPVQTEVEPTRSEDVPLPGLVSGTSAAAVRVALRGVSECIGYSPDHLTRVSLQNDLAESLTLPPANPDNDGIWNEGEFDGRSAFTHDFVWTHSGTDPELSDPLTVTIHAVHQSINCPADDEDIRNDILLNWLEIDYVRDFQSAGDELVFTYPDGDAEFEVFGLSTSAIDVYEITGDIGNGIADAVRLTSVQVTTTGPTFNVRFRMDNDPDIIDGKPRRFVVSGPGGVSVPAAADFVHDRVSTLASDTSQADLVVIAHPDVLSSFCSEGLNPCSYDVDCIASATDVCELDSSSVLSQFLTYRGTQGITSRLTRIGDVEDEFNDGLAGPLAVRNLLEWVLAGGWASPAPTYVMLLGDASYNYKGGAADRNLIYTQLMVKDSEILGFYASDNLMGAVAGDDQLTEFVIGRFAVETPADTDAALQKVLDYAQSPPSGDWVSNVLTVSDRANDHSPGEALGFEAMNQIGLDMIAGTSFTSQNLRYWSDNCAAPPADPDNPQCNKPLMRQEIKDAVNGTSGPGAILMQYAGHGNFDLWSSDVIFCSNEGSPFCTADDTSALTNGTRLPFLVVHNCLSGGFHNRAPKSFGERWVEYGSGGAIAVLAPSGLGFIFLGNAMTIQMWGDFFGPTKETELGVAVMNGLVRLCTQGSIEACQFYTLQGDPTLTLALPSVEPPGLPVATGGNAVVDLVWAASATPGVTYDLYRVSNLGNPYTKINASPLVGTSYSDTAVENARTYFYYALARDPDGFESRWSNFNTDCPSGPDCVTATPLNTMPPDTPGGLGVVDPESSGRLIVSWTPNAETDLLSYTLHWGETPALGNTRDVFGASTSLSGLTNGTPYYFAVLATNTSGFSSGLSPIASGVPSLVLGLKSPELIGDLRLGKSGSDAVLTWGAVTEDIYGKPTTVATYEVYRSEVAEFAAEVANLIGTTASPTFTDVGALAAAAPVYHYRVRPVDAEGSVGGFGRQLPGLITDLTLRPAILFPGKLALQWSPVTTDFDGEPSVITHYEIYAADAPFTRAAIRDGAVGLLLGNVTATTAQIDPPGQDRYYSVLAVDDRGNKSPF